MGFNPGSGRRAQRTPVPRKKACQECTAGKVRCDLQRPRCSRCEARQTACVYAVIGCVVDRASPTVDQGIRVVPLAKDGPGHIQAQNSPSEIRIGSSESAKSTFQAGQFQFSAGPQSPSQTPSLQSNLGFRNEFNEYWASDALSFTDINLICIVDPTSIRNRWLADFIPSITDRVKIYSPGVSSFIARVLKTYPQMLLNKGQLPPFIHPSQLSGPDLPTPLANCLSLVRLWDGQVRGSETIVLETVKKEMDRLHCEVGFSWTWPLYVFACLLTISSARSVQPNRPTRGVPSIFDLCHDYILLSPIRAVSYRPASHDKSSRLCA